MTLKYAVLLTESITIPGDERSRTHPGHGYPEHTVTHEVIKKFNDIVEFQQWIESNEKRTYGKQKYIAIEYTELKVTTTVSIDVSK